MENVNRETVLKLSHTVYPICELAEPARRLLAEKAQVEVLRNGTSLPAIDDARWITFLVQGELLISSDKGDEELINAGSPRARLPLFKIHPAGLQALAKHTSLLVRFDQKLYRKLLEQERLGDSGHEEIVVSSNHHEAPDSPLYLSIYKAYSSDQLELPTLPDIALRIREAIKDPSIGVKDVGKMVLADPVLSARLIQVANSAAYRRDTPVTTIYQAVTRLGLEAAQSIAMSLAVKHLFKAQSPLLRKRMQELYAHSTEVASIAYVLARHSHGFNPERALLAGLLHDIGVIPILTFADRHAHLGDNAAELDRTIQRLRSLTGHLVLFRLGFEPDIITAAEEADDWMRDGDKPADYADLVVIAQLHSYLGKPEMQHLPHIDTTPAYRKLALGEFDPSTGLAAVREAHNVSAAIQQMLH